VLLELIRHLAPRPTHLEGRKELLRYEKVPPELDPYLDNWDNSFKNREGQVKDFGNGYFILKDANQDGRDIPAGDKAFQGKFICW
jgi:hypothetical protein